MQIIYLLQRHLITLQKVQIVNTVDDGNHRRILYRKEGHIPEVF